MPYSHLVPPAGSLRISLHRPVCSNHPYSRRPLSHSKFSAAPVPAIYTQITHARLNENPQSTHIPSPIFPSPEIHPRPAPKAYLTDLRPPILHILRIIHHSLHCLAPRIRAFTHLLIFGRHGQGWLSGHLVSGSSVDLGLGGK